MQKSEFFKQSFAAASARRDFLSLELPFFLPGHGDAFLGGVPDIPASVVEDFELLTFLDTVFVVGLPFFFCAVFEELRLLGSSLDSFVGFAAGKLPLSLSLVFLMFNTCRAGRLLLWQSDRRGSSSFCAGCVASFNCGLVEDKLFCVLTIACKRNAGLKVNAFGDN